MKKKTQKTNQSQQFAVQAFDEEFYRLMNATDKRENKQALSIRLDPFVLQFFKGFGDKYQTRMSAVLRAYALRYDQTD